MIGECEIRTPFCTALTPAPITAVWGIPARRQTNVCGRCLEEMVRRGEWENPGAHLKRRFDIAVYDKDERLRLVADVKNYSHKHEGDLVQWGTRIRRNLVRHAAVPIYVYFLLAIYPAPFYLWLPEDAPDAPPRFFINVQAQMPQLQIIDALADYQQQVDAVGAWLTALMNTSREAEPSAWLHESGLYEAIQGGRIVRRTVQAEVKELLAA